MKVAIFSSHIKWPTHHETELDLMEGHLVQGDEVTNYVCNADLATCDLNKQHDLLTCAKCIGKRQHGLSLLSEKVKTVPFMNLTKENKAEITRVQSEFETVTELKNYEVGGFEIGMAVASSLIYDLQDSNLDTVLHRDLIYYNLTSSLSVYLSFQNHFEYENYDLIYIFNARRTHTRAVFSAARDKGIDCFIHDKGHKLNSYLLYKNVLVQDSDYQNELMFKHWEESKDDPKRKEIASKFYSDNLKGVKDLWGLSFVHDQEKSKLPANFDTSNKNVSVFISSEFEKASISKKTSTIYDGQLQGLKKIIDSIEKLAPDKFHIYIRMHPNLTNVKDRQIQDIYKLQSSYLTIIDADSPVSTYALLRSTDTVLTVGSTIGMEAVFWGIPSILTGMSHYYYLGGTYNPQTHEELMELLMSDLKPKDKTAALIYGYFRSTAGITHKYYKEESAYQGRFKGEKVHAFGLRKYRNLIRVVNLLSKFKLNVTAAKLHRNSKTKRITK